MFVQAKAGHAQGSTTERYLHASRTAYPDAAELAEARLFGVAEPLGAGTDEIKGSRQPSLFAAPENRF
jgi:hypothetical protein